MLIPFEEMHYLLQNITNDIKIRCKINIMKHAREGQENAAYIGVG